MRNGTEESHPKEVSNNSVGNHNPNGMVTINKVSSVLCPSDESCECPNSMMHPVILEDHVGRGDERVQTTMKEWDITRKSYGIHFNQALLQANSSAQYKRGAIAQAQDIQRINRIYEEELGPDICGEHSITCDRMEREVTTKMPPKKDICREMLKRLERLKPKATRRNSSYRCSCDTREFSPSSLVNVICLCILLK